MKMSPLSSFLSQCTFFSQNGNKLFHIVTASWQCASSVFTWYCAHWWIVISDSAISNETNEDVAHPDDADLTLPSSAVIDEVVEDVTCLSHSPQTQLTHWKDVDEDIGGIENRYHSQPPPLPMNVRPSISAHLGSVEPDYAVPRNYGMLLILFTKGWFMICV